MAEPKEIWRLKVTELPYVFLIGFNKTATRSLDYLFSSNGFPSVHYDEGRLALRMLENLVNNKKIFDGYDNNFKVYSDMIFINDCIDVQCNKFFRIMDRDYPQSYFIYNKRDTEDWVQSRLRHREGGRSFIEMSMNIYNTKDTDEVKNIWKEEKKNFESELRKYFKGMDRYLEIDIQIDNVCSSISKLLNIKLNCEHWKHIGKNIE